MAPNKENQPPREALTGWRLHDAAGWALLAVAVGGTAAAWMPAEWKLMRALLQEFGCFASGMIIAAKGAIWQRTGRKADSGTTKVSQSHREPLTGWRHHPDAVGILLGALLVGVGGMTLVPADYPALRTVMQLFGMLAAGMLASKDAAVWQRCPQRGSGR